MDIATTLGSLAGELFKLGAPQLGGIIGAAIGGPAGTLVGGLAGKVIDELAGKLKTEPTPEAITTAIEEKPVVAAAVVAEVESKAPEMIRLWEIEAQRVSEAQTAEIARGFTAWQIMRNVIQGIVWGGWTVILLSALFGGHGFVKPTMPVAEIVTAWGSVTWVWMLVYHGGHTLKEVAPVLVAGFGKRG